MNRDDESALPDALRGLSWTQSDIYDAPEWYDVDYAGYRGEESFYRFVLGLLPAPAFVVELGAGTGRLALRFADEGHRVHAVEPARAMRERLVTKRAARDITVEDARGDTFAARDRIDAVLFPFNGILHLRTRADLIATFAHVATRLRPGAIFALDCTGPYWDAMLYGPSAWGRTDERVHPITGKKVLTCDRARFDSATRRIHIDIRYFVVGEARGAQVELVQTMWTWQEVLSALDETGFVVEHRFGDVNLAPFDEGSPRLLVSARRA